MNLLESWPICGLDALPQNILPAPKGKMSLFFFSTLLIRPYMGIIRIRWKLVTSSSIPPKFSNYLKLMVDFANTNNTFGILDFETPPSQKKSAVTGVPLDHGMTGFS